MINLYVYRHVTYDSFLLGFLYIINMDLMVSDKNVLINFIKDFVFILNKLNIKYIIVSGFVAISHGRSRGTEDIDIIIENLSKEKFVELNDELDKNGFETLQGVNGEELFEDYLEDKLSIRYVRKGEFLPEMELKMAQDELDKDQLTNRTKLPLTGLDFYFSTIETNLAFKEELLKSPKDLADAKHLRIIYGDKINETEVERIKKLIIKCRF